MAALKSPFFILGCARSGTTLLRNVLRMHSSLVCPEETHFFRWGFPFASDEFFNIVHDDPTLKFHRELDRISGENFARIYETAESLKELQSGYAEALPEWRVASKHRWFDKTPQNVYGMLLISGMYPDAKFIHMHRHPLNVVASLKQGKVMPKHTVLAGINMWLEAATIVAEYDKAWPARVINVSYERLTDNPQSELESVLGFISEPWEDQLLQKVAIHPERNQYEAVLTEQEIAQVRRLLKEQMAAYGYG